MKILRNDVNLNSRHSDTCTYVFVVTADVTYALAIKGCLGSKEIMRSR